MVRGKKVEKELYWRDILKRHAVSGLSIRRFCADEGVSQPSFYAWRRRLQEPEPNNGGQRLGQPGTRAPVKGGEFIQVKMLAAQSTLEIVHPHGIRVRVSGDVDANALAQILDVLDRRSGR